MFGHILNFMRTGRPLLPEGFDQFELLLEEARYYELTGTCDTRKKYSTMYSFYRSCEHSLEFETQEADKIS